jgi:hypothetical protein
MARTLDQFFRSAAVGLSGPHRELLPEDVAVAFEVEGPGGGRWYLRRDARAARIVPEPAEGVDARLLCSVADFEALIDGSLDGREGYLNGRLKIEGDVGLILALQGAFTGR